uniref:(northern house mosquito) hypothetical protein n=1 Tax=Culex pipiens TaxID=7175 RepID=A0A8D8E5Y1_CULPI
MELHSDRFDVWLPADVADSGECNLRRHLPGDHVLAFHCCHYHAHHFGSAHKRPEAELSQVSVCAPIHPVGWPVVLCGRRVDFFACQRCDSGHLPGCLRVWANHHSGTELHSHPSSWPLAVHLHGTVLLLVPDRSGRSCNNVPD